MSRPGIFFGTETGRTRRLAKQIARQRRREFAIEADKAARIWGTSVADLPAFDVYLPGLDQPGWAELIPRAPAASTASPWPYGCPGSSRRL